MARLNWEIWVWAIQDDGQELHMCTVAGPEGDAQRAMNEPGARLLHTYEAETRFEAMTYYHRYLGREPYSTVYAEDFEPFTEERLRRQKHEDGQ